MLKCADDTLYVGATSDLERRLDQHNNSKRGAKYTKARRPVELVHVETFATLSEALKREAEIKRWKRQDKLKLIAAPPSRSSKKPKIGASISMRPLEAKGPKSRRNEPARAGVTGLNKINKI